MEIQKANYLEDYKIQINFFDEKDMILDFEGFLSTAKNPMSKKIYIKIYLKTLI